MGSSAMVHMTALQPGGVGEDAEQRRRDAADADRGAERDAGCEPSRLGRYSWPMTTVTLKRHDRHEADRRRAARRRARSPDTTNASSSGSCTASDADEDGAAADAVDEPAAHQRADRARHEHRGQRVLPAASVEPNWWMNQSGHERLQAEVDARAQRDHAAEAREGVPVVLGLRRRSARPPDGRCRASRACAAARPEARRRHDRGRHDQRERAAQAEHEDERRDRIGPSAKPALPPTEKRLMPRAAPRAGGVVRRSARPRGGTRRRRGR